MDKNMRQALSTFDFLHSSHKWIQTILSCGKHSTTLQIGIISRFWFCRRSRRLKINIRWTPMHFRKSNICANKLDVQETDISLTQLNRSWTYFSWCRFKDGRYSSFGSLKFGKRGATKTNPLKPRVLQHRETCGTTSWQAHGWKIKAKLQPRATILNCFMLTMSLRMWDFLSPLLFCTCLRTMKPWLWWKSKAGVQRWDMCQGSTEFLFIGCLTEITWTPRFRSGTLTPDTRSQTYWQKDTSHMTNGTIFFICSTSAISALFVVPRIFSLISCTKRMAKRMQEQEEENRIVAKARPPAMNLTSSVPTSSSSVYSPVASRCPGIFKASSRQVGLSEKPGASANLSSNSDAASSSQGWQRDAQLFRETCGNRQGSEVSESTGEICHEHRETCAKDVQKIQKLQKIQKSQNPKVEIGHIISEYHHIMLITWRKSSRS